MSAEQHDRASPLTDVKLAARVAQRVLEINYVLLRKATVESNAEPDDDAGRLLPTQRVGARWERRGEDQLRVELTFVLTLRRDGTEAESKDGLILSVEATYAVGYTIRDLASATDRELEYFAQLNGAVNLWPYWRELVHSVASRVGMGGVMMPIYRPRPRPVPEHDAAPEAEASS